MSGRIRRARQALFWLVNRLATQQNSDPFGGEIIFGQRKFSLLLRKNGWGNG